MKKIESDWDIYQTADSRVSKIKFTTEFEGVINCPSGQYELTIYPEALYYGHLEPGTTENFSHIYFGSVHAMFDVPNSFFKKILDTY